MDQSHQDFLLEIEELIEQVFADLDELRDKRDEGPARRKLLESIFRRVHSIKGLSASSGLDQVSKLAHHLETLLAAIRAGRVGLTDAVLDTIEGAGNLLADSLRSVPSADIESAFTALLAHLQEFNVSNTTALPAKAEAALSKLPSEIWQSLAEDQKGHLARVLEEGANLFVIASRFDIADFDQQFYRLKEKIEEFGELVSTYPTVDAKEPNKINFRLLFASASNFHQIRAEVTDFRGLSLTNLSGVSTTSETNHKPSGSQRSLSRPSQNSVRLDLNELDGLIAASHELFRITTDALEHAIVNAPEGGAGDTLQTRAGQIRKEFLKIEAQIINLRMVSIGGILKRAERAGRAAARLANKDVSLETVGLELRLDKLLADAIANPLLHLMRNAVDHGIETADERARLGKPSRGLIRVEATGEGSQTRIRVTDDGRGIDPLLVSQAAQVSGLIEKDVVLDMDHSLRLIFRPGFSTAGDVSTTSGRGVGLDVVETAVEQAGGEVLVSTEPGRGSTFEIRLPVTFGLLHSTVVTSDNNRYCIDLSHVVATPPLLETSSEGSANGRERVSSADPAVPLIHLSELLGHSAAKATAEAAAEDKETAVVTVTCQFSNEEHPHCKRVALVVDSIEGTEEVLVRNLGRYAGRWYGIAGATELRDGTVALVLDLPRLVHASAEINL